MTAARTNIPAPRVAVVDPQTGYASREWFRFFLNPVFGAPLNVGQGGTGVHSGHVGGVLAFSTTSTLISSPALAANQIVFGGAAAGPSTPLALGTSTQVLKGNAAGLPSWGPVTLTSDVAGVLPVLNGGTGVTTKTGIGSVVLNTTPDIVGPTLTSPYVISQITWLPLVSATVPQVLASDGNEVSVTGSVTQLVSQNVPLFAIVKDKTSGGMACLLMDATSGVVDFANSIAGITFTQSAVAPEGLRAQVISGANPRLLSVFSICTGTNT